MILDYSIENLDIDDEKKVAVKLIEGPILIIAGPGSGKTKTLVERIVYLISKGIKSEEIPLLPLAKRLQKSLSQGSQIVCSK